MTKVFIGTPAYSGEVLVPYAISLVDTCLLLASKGITYDLKIHTCGSLLCAERNRLVKSFLMTDCTHMLCVDSDLGWPPMAVEKLLAYDEDFVAGVYPSRKDRQFTFRPVFKEDDSLMKSEKNLLEMEYIPAGFMLIKRCVFERMMLQFPQLEFVPKAEEMKKESGFCFFNTELWEGEFWGEDYTFCRYARESGTKIYVDPCIEFDHAGVRGMLLQALTEDKEKALKK